MASHLPQLRSLSISGSKNAQVPYLLRVVLPGGLPNLKSLEIHQYFYGGDEGLNIEGTMWYEMENGDFMQEVHLHKAQRMMKHQYMYSIVRGAPNIEELCLQGLHLSKAAIVSLIARKIESIH